MSATEQPLPIPLATPDLGEEERLAVLRVLDSGMLAQGPEVAAFEHEFSRTVGGLHCVAVNSGTSALHIGLLASGIGRGDEVIVPSFTFAATANAVVLTGATPVFVDIDPFSYCVSPDAVRAAIGPRTAAIMPVHLYGQPADMAEVCAIADQFSLAVFEDAAQAHLSEFQGRPVGTFGQFAAYSFYPTKNMTTGEGGMLVTPDDVAARQMRLLRNQGMETRYLNEIVGFNARMTDLAAAIGRAQLKKLRGWTEARRRNAGLFDAGLTSVRTPGVAQGSTHVYHQYTVRVDNRQCLVDRLEHSRIGYGIYYENPVHRLPSFDTDDDLPETMRAAAEVLSLPVHPGLTNEHIERIIEVVES